MVAPVTGPYYVNYEYFYPAAPGGFARTRGRVYKESRRQKRPYNLPLPFVSDHCRVESQNSATGLPYYSYFDTKAWLFYPSAPPCEGFSAAYNIAYGRFVNKLKENQAQLGAALGEHRKSLQMISDRALQIRQVWLAVRRFRFVEALRILDVPVTDSRGRKLSTKRSAADNFLELSFGWMPLIGDIANAIDTLQRGVPPVAVKAAGKIARKASYLDPPSAGGKGWLDSFEVSADYRVVIGADIRIDNPNLFLANQLGLVNPAAIAWELIPFSFVFNYFVDVEGFLNSFTDFYGLSITNAYQTYKFSCVSSEHVHGITATSRSATASHRSVTRNVGAIPGPELRIREPWRLSPQRAATSIALLLQAMRK